MDETNTPPTESLVVHEPVFLIELEKISPNPYQPRRVFDEAGIRELANSIRELGLLQPIVVRKIEEVVDGGTRVRYELIAGERRFRACQYLGLDRVPAIIKNVDLDRTRLEMAIVENVQRANLNPIESARAYARLQDEFHLTQREIATRIGKSREVIANTLRLLNLPTNMQEAISGGELSESQARLILSIEDPTIQQQMFEQVLKDHLSVRDIRARIERLKKQSVVKPEPVTKEVATTVDPEAVSMQRELEEFLGAPVKLEASGDTGKITIQYFSPEELKAIIQKMIRAAHDAEMAAVTGSDEEGAAPEVEEKGGAGDEEEFYI